VHIHSNGTVHDKPTLLHHIESRGGAVRVERGPLNVRIMGDVAVIVGPITNHMPSPDGQTTQMFGVVTQVVRRDESGWRFISSHFTSTLA